MIDMSSCKALSVKVNKAVEVLRSFEPSEGYYVAYSGGKDSDCVRILCELAGVRHELHHNLTTVDAPETIQYIKVYRTFTLINPVIVTGNIKQCGI